MSDTRNTDSARTVPSALMGAIGFRRFVLAHGGVFLGSPANGRTFRGGADVALAVAAQGFTVERHTGPRDPKTSRTAQRKAEERHLPNTWIALTPVGALVVP